MLLSEKFLQAGKHVAYMVLHRLGADSKFFRNLLIGKIFIAVQLVYYALLVSQSVHFGIDMFEQISCDDPVFYFMSAVPSSVEAHVSVMGLFMLEFVIDHITGHGEQICP